MPRTLQQRHSLSVGATRVVRVNATDDLDDAGKAILFTASGGTAGTEYRVRVTCGTDSSPAETLVYDLLLDWE